MQKYLLRRAAFGGSAQEIQAFLDKYDSVDEAVDDLLSFSTSNKRPPSGGRDFYRAQIKQRQWWVKSMLKASTSPKDALREKLTLFWHGHLCSGYSKQPQASYMSIQNGLLRRYAKGNFRNLIRDFNRDPANLYYLDGITNYASADGVHVAANENFGREVLELFTVGISEFAADGTNDPLKPNYTAGDVHQLARALTGWVEIDKDVGIWHDWAWDGGQYDDDGDDNPDPITIFGTTNSNFKIGEEVAGTSNDVLKLIFEQTDTAGNPQAAMFICRKLWTYFAYPAPAPGLKALLAGFAAILDGANYEIATVLAAMMKSDEFYSDEAKSRTVKNPIDYMVGTLRMLGIKSNGKTIGDSDELIDMLGNMGMYLFEPPNVAGWPGGKRWITTGTLVSRLDFARQVAELDYSGSALHLETVVTMGSSTASPATVLDEIIARCQLDGTAGGVALTNNQKAALLNFLTNQSSLATLDLSQNGSNNADLAERLVRGTISLVLQSAEAMVF